MALPAPLEPDDTDANIVSRTEHLGPRTGGNAKRNSSGGGSAKKTPAIDLFHRINSDLTFKNCWLLRFFSGVFGITLRHFRLLLVPFVNIEPVFEGDAFAGGDFQVSGAGGLFLEIVDSKGIGRKKAVVPDVPRGRMPRVARVIENGHANDLVTDRSIVIAPRTLLAPRGFIAHPRAQHDTAVGFAGIELVGGQPHRFSKPNGHRAFLGISENHFPIAGEDRYFKIKDPLIFRTRVGAK